jgi:hypothetical protein
VAFRYIDLRIRDYARALMPVTAITLVMVVGVVAVRLAMPDGVPDPATLLIQIATGGLIYLGLIVRLRPAAFVDLLSALRRRRVSEAKTPVAHAAG